MEEKERHKLLKKYYLLEQERLKVEKQKAEIDQLQKRFNEIISNKRSELERSTNIDVDLTHAQLLEDTIGKKIKNNPIFGNVYIYLYSAYSKNALGTYGLFGEKDWPSVKVDFYTNLETGEYKTVLVENREYFAQENIILPELLDFRTIDKNQYANDLRLYYLDNIIKYNPQFVLDGMLKQSPEELKETVYSYTRSLEKHN